MQLRDVQLFIPYRLIRDANSRPLISATESLLWLKGSVDDEYGGVRRDANRIYCYKQIYLHDNIYVVWPQGRRLPRIVRRRDRG